MAEKNNWLDMKIRDKRGTYRKTFYFDDDKGPVVHDAICAPNDMEDALIEALDAGLSAEEIADIQLGAIS